MKKIFIAAAIVAIAAVGVSLTLISGGDIEAEPFVVPGHTPMTPSQLTAESYRVVPFMLVRIYAAFAENEEDTIYDALAEVAAGDALEQLYLERVGALAGGGLEPDQTLHAMDILHLESKQMRRQVSVDAQWRVVGTVGHDEHLHVRGNTYSAELRLAPMDGAWRITTFELTDVDRSEAGQTRRDGTTDDWSAPK